MLPKSRFAARSSAESRVYDTKVVSSKSSSATQASVARAVKMTVPKLSCKKNVRINQVVMNQMRCFKKFGVSVICS